MIFSLKNRNLIAAAIQAAEARTSGEIVPVFVERSHSYLGFFHFFALMGLLSGTALGAYFWWTFPFYGFAYFLGAQLMGWMLGWQFGSMGPVFRALHSPKKRRDLVHEAALASFFRNGLHLTKDRTGVLIYISDFEHCVEIVADEGIYKKLPADFWDHEVKKLSQAIAAGSIAQTLPVVIEEVGKKLAEFFPRLANDKNEISDSLRSN
jgi:putative membrane protein